MTEADYGTTIAVPIHFDDLDALGIVHNAGSGCCSSAR